MKGFGFLSGCILLAGYADAQQQPGRGAAYGDTVPLFIHTKVFENLTHTKNTFVFLSPAISVSIAESKDSVVTDALMSVAAKSMNPAQLLKVEFGVAPTGHTHLLWKSIAAGKLLLDTVLSENDSIQLLFRLKGHKRLLQQTILKRVAWIPEIAMIRTSPNPDSTNRKLVAKAVYENRNLPKGFRAVNDNTIQISAGNTLELGLRLRSLNKDSSIEYNITDVARNDMDKWIHAGHLITISRLSAGHAYRLLLRYPANGRIKPYSVIIDSWWWERWWAIALFFVAFAAIAIIVMLIIKEIKRKRTGRAIELAMEKSKKEQNKLDTHWLDNTLHAVLGFIRNNENELADEYLGKISKVLRDKLIHGERLLIPFKDDLKILTDYISSEQLKHSFQYHINVDPLLNIDSIQLPPLLWQPCLENAVKHGEYNGGGAIVIKIYAKEKGLIMEIRNPGKLMVPSFDAGRKFGISITQERVRGWNMANPGSPIHFDLKWVDNEVLTEFVFERWLE